MSPCQRATAGLALLTGGSMLVLDLAADCLGLHREMLRLLEGDAIAATLALLTALAVGEILACLSPTRQYPEMPPRPPLDFRPAEEITRASHLQDSVRPR